MQDTIIRALCWTLLHSLWQGVMLAVCAGVLLLLSKKSAAALRYNLLVGLFVFFTIAISFTFYLQIHNGDGNKVLQGTGFSVHERISAKQAAGIPVPDNSLQKIIASFVEYFNTHASLVVLVWFCVFLARFVKIISGLAYVQRIRHYKTSPVPEDWQEKLEDLKKRLQISQPVLLLESALLKIPVVLGWLKPVILIPAGMLTRLSASQVESILLHELAHIRRRDYLLNLLQHVIDTIFFFNPAVLWVSSLIRSERENCCDDIAIMETSSRKQFIEALVSFHQYSDNNSGFALSFASGQKQQLLKRVQRIINKKNHSLRSSERTALSIILLLTGAAFITVNDSRPAARIKEEKKIFVAQNITEILPAHKANSTANVSVVTANHVAIVRQASKQMPETVQPVSIPVVTDTVPANNDREENVNHIDNELARFRRQLQQMGYNQPGDDRLLQQYLDHGLSVAYINSFIKADYNNIPLNKLQQLIDHGVNTAFIQGFKGLGYNNLSVDKAIELADHGITAAYINSFIQFGLKNISLNDAIKLFDHGVTIAFVESVKRKTGSVFTLEEYIKLRDSGVSFLKTNGFIVRPGNTLTVTDLIIAASNNEGFTFLTYKN